MKRRLLSVLAILATLALGACATMNETGYTVRGGPAEADPPQPVKTIAEVPANQSTYHYQVDIYPGLDEKFDPNPKLTLAEHNQLTQLDWYCAKKVGDLEGEFKEMMKQAGIYGVLQGVMGAIGTQLAFGRMVGPLDYLAYIGFTGAGGGLGSGKITYQTMLNVAHGYCMTSMVYKADELEGKLRRITIVPLYTGKAKRLEVSDAPAPTYPERGSRFLPPPPR